MNQKDLIAWCTHTKISTQLYRMSRATIPSNQPVWRKYCRQVSLVAKTTVSGNHCSSTQLFLVYRETNTSSKRGRSDHTTRQYYSYTSYHCLIRSGWRTAPHLCMTNSNVCLTHRWSRSENKTHTSRSRSYQSCTRIMWYSNDGSTCIMSSSILICSLMNRRTDINTDRASCY